MIYHGMNNGCGKKEWWRIKGRKGLYLGRFMEEGREIYHGVNNFRRNFPQVWKRKSKSVI